MRYILTSLIILLAIGSANADMDWTGSSTATATPAGNGPASGAPSTICIRIDGATGTLGECGNPLYALSQITSTPGHLSAQFVLNREWGSLNLWSDAGTNTYYGTIAFDDIGIGRIDVSNGRK